MAIVIVGGSKFTHIFVCLGCTKIPTN